MSATPFRQDGLGNAIFASVGPRLHKVDKEYLHQQGAVLKPEVITIETRFSYAFADDYSKMLSALTEDEARNTLILQKIVQDYEKNRESILVVSDRKKHCEKLSETLRIGNRVLTGSTKKSEREEIVEDLRSGKVKVLFSTIQLVGEGFDVPGLSALFITTPIKFSGRVIQVVGRILRPSKGKKPRVYDFRDNRINVLYWSGIGRDRIYKKQWG